jgi:hypothetical protein
VCEEKRKEKEKNALSFYLHNVAKAQNSAEKSEYEFYYAHFQKSANGLCLQIYTLHASFLAMSLILGGCWIK